MANGWGGARANSGPKKRSQGGPTYAKTRLSAQPRPPASFPDAAPMDPRRVASLVDALARAGFALRNPMESDPAKSPFKLPAFPPGAVPPDRQLAMDAGGIEKASMAMDDASAWATSQWALNGGGLAGFLAQEGAAFPGYPTLANLAQLPEYRIISETVADDMTREWIEWDVAGDENEERDKREAKNRDPVGELEREGDPDERKKRLDRAGLTDKVKALTDDQDRLEARDRFYQVIRDDGFFGRSHLFLGFGDNGISDLAGNAAELKLDIGDGRNEMTRGKVGERNKLRELKVIEAVWTYPQAYNAINPLLPYWYDPQQWYVMGAEVHQSRLLKFIGHPVPDLLKPAYSFGGLSLTQMATPYVNIWLQTRESVAALIKAFSVMVLATDLQTQTAPGAAAGGIVARAQLFNMLRDNMGLMVTNKSSEEFKNVSAPISGLDHLQAQAQEHLTFPSRIPIVKMTGNQPTGLNASTDGEIRMYYDTISSSQNRTMRPNLTRVVNFEQVSLFGGVDPKLKFKFKSLYQMTPKEQADLEKAQAERDQTFVDMGAIAPEEVRVRVIKDDQLPYTDLNPEDVPDLLQEEEEGLEPEGGRPQPQAGEGGGAPPKKPEPKEGGGQDSVVPFFGAEDAEWSEADHPRGEGGKFSTAAGGGGAHEMPPIPSFLKRGEEPKTNVGPPLDTRGLKRVGKQMGSNPGGVFENEAAERFYVKQGKSPAHVTNEMIAAALYDLAGTPTLRYRQAGPNKIATEMAKLDKDRAGKLSPEEVREAQKDLAVHAWLANWDAVGMGGDNLGTVGGVPTALDLGGALEYRAQGGPKGGAFGSKVGELDTLRDPKMNPDSARVFGGMTPAALRESISFVTDIPDEAIEKTVERMGGKPELAQKLIARKNDLAERAKTVGAQGDPKKPDSVVVFAKGEKTPKELNGVAFEKWTPPADWADVEGQAELEEPPLDAGTKRAASGLLIREPDGRVWLARPTKGFGGYQHTFPKGGVERGLSPQANAIKEAFEETGLKARITGLAGDHEGDTSVTRYYFAERTGGDPAEHGWESDGVVLAPADKLEGFLNRSRDRKVAESLAQDEFKESDHPRAPDGKFAESGGGGGGGGESKEKAAAYGGLYETKGASPKENHALTVSKVLATKPQIGIHYRRLLAALIKEAPSFGGESAVPKLKEHLVQSLVGAHENAVKKGKTAEAAKLQATLSKLGGLGAMGGQKAPSLAPPPKPVSPPPPPPKPSFPPPTPQELEKAKKTVALQVKYVPGAAELSGPAWNEAQKLVDSFNAKWADKTIVGVHALTEKVNDFKTLTAQMKPLAEMEATKQKELAAQQAAEAKAKAAEAAAKAKAEAERNAQKNAAVMAELGITAQQAEGFNALVKMLGGKTGDVVADFKKHASAAAAYGYPLSGFESAIIMNYSNGGYGEVNEALRSGSWTIAQDVYVAMANQAVGKMPKHKGSLWRGASLTSAQQARYKEGHVVLEEALTSTSTSSASSQVNKGNTKFHITSIGKRGSSIKQLSHYGGENEVLYKSHTFFKVTKVESSGGKTHVHMEEMEKKTDD